MSRYCLSPMILVCLIMCAFPALAQTTKQSAPTARPPVPSSNAAGRDRSEAKAEADRLAKERRAQARSLLVSLASDARSFRDQPLRARTLSRIADVLWSVDAEQGRALFRKAWDSAETGDRESQEHSVAGHWPPNLRGEVLKLTARRDRLLAEEFLQKLKTDQEGRINGHSETDPWSLTEASEQRLGVARRLLRAGDSERALQFADPVLGSVTMSTVDFLSELREKLPAAADQRYAAMLANTGGNMLADANTISLLSSYIFTPHLYVIGSGYTIPPTSFPPSSVGPQLRLAFFQTAAGVLLRPQPPPDQDQSTAGIVELAAKYRMVKRLMPLFEQYAPPAITEEVRSQFEALSTLVGDQVRQEESEWLQKGISPEKPLADQEQPLLDQVEHARTSSERDALYVKLALLALSKDDLKARDYVSKIEHSEYRKRVQAWVDACLAINAIKQKKTARALELARTGELTHIQHLWLLTQLTKLLVKSDRDRALSLLDEATAEVPRVEGAGLDRPRGLLAIANTLKLIEPTRAWDAVFEAIKAANSTDAFTGEDGVLNLGENPLPSIGSRTESVPDFDIEGIIGQLANDDYDRAVQLARGFQGEAARANATIAIARAVLEIRNTPIKSETLTAKPGSLDR